jgi:hypothetical protein
LVRSRTWRVPLESGGCALDKLGVFRDPEIELRILCVQSKQQPRTSRAGI